MHLDLQLQDQHSSPTESTTSRPHMELAPMGKTSSQDTASSGSVHDEAKTEPQIKPAMFVCNPELSMNVTQPEMSQPMVQTVQYPYGYPDPYLGGLFTYGPHAMFQPQVMGAGAGRVALPADLPEDGPIFVNAKQYHGILRRRQTRAKLEAQNKLVKNRRPYLHESRHQHALNRVRGTGGRFLSTKKTQHSAGSNQATSSQNALDAYHFNQHESMLHSNHHQYENRHRGSSSTTEGISVSSADAGFQHMVMSMQGGGGLVYNGTCHYASSTVR